MLLPSLPPKLHVSLAAGDDAVPVEAGGPRKVPAGAFCVGPRPGAEAPKTNANGLKRRPALVRHHGPHPLDLHRPVVADAAIGAAPHALPVQPSAVSRFDRSAAVRLAAPLLAPLYGFHTARFQGPFLTPSDRRRPRVALSPVFAHGGFSEIRYGRDENGVENVWRSVWAHTPDDKTVARLDDISLRSEMICLADIGSPLLPLQTHVDSDGRFHSEIKEFSGSMEALKFFIDGDEEARLPGQASKLAVAAAVRVGKDIAKQLIVLHERGWVHRDIKPDNIFYRPETGAVLADFGLVASVNVERPNAPIKGFVGTPRFMAPETDGSGGMGETSHYPSDIFQLGLTLADLVTKGRLLELRDIEARGLFRYGTLLDLNHAAHDGLHAQTIAPLSRADRAVAFVARTDPQFSRLIFSNMLATEPSARCSAFELLAQLDAIQPEGDKADIAARRALDLAAVKYQNNAPRSKRAEFHYQRLRALFPKRTETETIS